MKYTAACLLAVASLNDHVEASVRMSASPAIHLAQTEEILHPSGELAPVGQGETCEGTDIQTGKSYAHCDKTKGLVCVPKHPQDNDKDHGNNFWCQPAGTPGVPTNNCSNNPHEPFNWLCEAEYIMEGQQVAIIEWAGVVQPGCNDWNMNSDIFQGLSNWEQLLLRDLEQETAAVIKLAEDRIQYDHPPLLDFSSFTNHASGFLAAQRAALEALETDLESEHSDAISAMGDYHDEGENSRGEHVGFDVYQEGLGMASSNSSANDSHSDTTSDDETPLVCQEYCIYDGTSEDHDDYYVMSIAEVKAHLDECKAEMDRFGEWTIVGLADGKWDGSAYGRNFMPGQQYVGQQGNQLYKRCV